MGEILLVLGVFVMVLWIMFMSAVLSSDQYIPPQRRVSEKRYLTITRTETWHIETNDREALVHKLLK